MAKFLAKGTKKVKTEQFTADNAFKIRKEQEAQKLLEEEARLKEQNERRKKEMAEKQRQQQLDLQRQMDARKVAAYPIQSYKDVKGAVSPRGGVETKSVKSKRSRRSNKSRDSNKPRSPPKVPRINQLDNMKAIMNKARASKIDVPVSEELRDITDPHKILQKYLVLPANKKSPSMLLRKFQDLTEGAEDLGALILQASKEMTSTGQFNEARDFLKLCCDRMSQTIVFNEASRVFFVMGLYDESIEYCKMAAASYETDKAFSGNVSVEQAEQFSDMSRCIFMTKDKTRMEKEGLEYVEEALKLDPNCANAWLNKGNIQNVLGYKDKAKECYNKAKECKNELAGALTNLGNLDYENGDYEAACFNYLYALEKDPEDSETLCNLGLALSQTQYKDYANIAFEEAVNAAPANQNLLMNYLLFLLEIQQFDKFKKIFSHAGRILDKSDLKSLENLYQEFHKAVTGENAMFSINQDNNNISGSMVAGMGSGSVVDSMVMKDSEKAKISPNVAKKIGSIFGNIMKKRTMRQNQSISAIEEQDEDDY